MGGGEKARPPQRMKPQPSPAPATLPGVGAAVPELSERGSSTRRKRLGLQLGITPKACEEASIEEASIELVECSLALPNARWHPRGRPLVRIDDRRPRPRRSSPPSSTPRLREP